MQCVHKYNPFLSQICTQILLILSDVANLHLLSGARPQHPTLGPPSPPLAPVETSEWRKSHFLSHFFSLCSYLSPHHLHIIENVSNWNYF